MSFNIRYLNSITTHAIPSYSKDFIVKGGQIIIEESFIPFNEKNAEREIKMAGDTGIPCLLDGQPIYRRQRYTTNMNEQDLLIQHNNTAQIKEAIDANKELNLILE